MGPHTEWREMSQPLLEDLDDRGVVAALLARDERVFRALTRKLYGSMLHVASMYCRSEAVSQEVIQETWMGVLSGLERFEFRSALKTWIFRILANRARSRAKREGRMVSLDAILEEGGDALDPSRFDSRGSWAAPPVDFDPERCADDARFLAALSEELEKLPASQRSVVVLRDVQGLTSDEVARALDLSLVHVRVLLHRGRVRLRAGLEASFGVR